MAQSEALKTFEARTTQKSLAELFSSIQLKDAEILRIAKIDAIPKTAKTLPRELAILKEFLPKVQQLEHEITTLETRQRGLERLDDKVSVQEINDSIQSRRNLLKTKPNQPGISVEIAVLEKRKKALEMFEIHIAPKGLLELTQSNTDRQTLLSKSQQKPESFESHQEHRRLKWEINVITKRKEQLHLIRARFNTKSYAELQQSITSREKMITSKTATSETIMELTLLKSREKELHYLALCDPKVKPTEIAKRKAAMAKLSPQKNPQIYRALQIELDILEGRTKIIFESKTGIAPHKRKDVSPVKIASAKPERRKPEAKFRETMGTHGILVTQRLKKGIEITQPDGRMIPLRRGSPREFIVSDKSHTSWSNDFARLLSFAPSIPGGLPEAQRRQLEIAAQNRRKIIQLIGASYITDAQFLNTFIGAMSSSLARDLQPKEVRGALDYLRWLFETKLGKAVDPTMIKQRANELTRLKALFRAVSAKDETVRKHVLSALPSGGYAPDRELDGLYLGLLLRDLDENPAAQKEHKLNELAQLLSLP